MVAGYARGEPFIVDIDPHGLVGRYEDIGFHAIGSGSAMAQQAAALLAHFSMSREEEVLILAARGWTNSEIAEELHISLSTVKTHLAGLMRKLNARNRVQIAMWAYETNRIKP